MASPLFPETAHFINSMQKIPNITSLQEDNYHTTSLKGDYHHTTSPQGATWKTSPQGDHYTSLEDRDPTSLLYQETNQLFFKDTLLLWDITFIHTPCWPLKNYTIEPSAWTTIHLPYLKTPLCSYSDRLHQVIAAQQKERATHVVPPDRKINSGNPSIGSTMSNPIGSWKGNCKIPDSEGSGLHLAQYKQELASCPSRGPKTRAQAHALRQDLRTNESLGRFCTTPLSSLHTDSAGPPHQSFQQSPFTICGSLDCHPFWLSGPFQVQQVCFP